MTATNSRSRDHTDLSAPQLADQLAIRGLVDAYAYCADRRDAAGQMALFTEDTEFSRIHGQLQSHTDATPSRPGCARAGVRRPEPVPSHHPLQWSSHHDARQR